MYRKMQYAQSSTATHTVPLELLRLTRLEHQFANTVLNQDCTQFARISMAAAASVLFTSMAVHFDQGRASVPLSRLLDNEY